jgi:hypothetical protein
MNSLFRDLTRSFCPTNHDLQRHIALLEKEEAREAALEQRHQFHYVAYLQAGDFYDALGYDNQESDLNALFQALSNSDLATAQKLTGAILDRAAGQYAKRQIEEDMKTVEAGEDFHLSLA